MAMERDKGNDGGGDATRPDAATIRAALLEVAQGRAGSELPPGEAAELAASYRRSLTEECRHCLEYLESGDYQQAAKKAWYAYAASVLAIGADYGVKLSYDLHLSRAGGGLATLVCQSNPDDASTLSSGLHLARSLYQHIFDNALDPRTVEFSIGWTLAAIDVMQRRFGLVGGNGAAPEGE